VQPIGGFTALYVAAQNGHAEVTQTLLELGADLNRATSHGLTPLSIARARGHEAAVTALVDAITTRASSAANR